MKSTLTLYLALAGVVVSCYALYVEHMKQADEDYQVKWQDLGLLIVFGKIGL